MILEMIILTQIYNKKNFNREQFYFQNCIMQTSQIILNYTFFQLNICLTQRIENFK